MGPLRRTPNIADHEKLETTGAVDEVTATPSPDNDEDWYRGVATEQNFTARVIV